jgi:hypothetical protein
LLTEVILFHEFILRAQLTPQESFLFYLEIGAIVSVAERM